MVRMPEREGGLKYPSHPPWTPWLIAQTAKKLGFGEDDKGGAVEIAITTRERTPEEQAAWGAEPRNRTICIVTTEEPNPANLLHRIPSPGTGRCSPLPRYHRCRLELL